jgi:hypothetical protein
MAAEIANASVRIPLGFTSFSLFSADFINRLDKRLTHCPGPIQIVGLHLLREAGGGAGTSQCF